jgi:hypothetical protein
VGLCGVRGGWSLGAWRLDGSRRREHRESPHIVRNRHRDRIEGAGVSVNGSTWSPRLQADLMGWRFLSSGYSEIGLEWTDGNYTGEFQYQQNEDRYKQDGKQPRQPFEPPVEQFGLAVLVQNGMS